MTAVSRVLGILRRVRARGAVPATPDETRGATGRRRGLWSPQSILGRIPNVRCRPDVGGVAARRSPRFGRSSRSDLRFRSSTRAGNVGEERGAIEPMHDETTRRTLCLFLPVAFSARGSAGESGEHGSRRTWFPCCSLETNSPGSSGGVGSADRTEPEASDELAPEGDSPRRASPIDVAVVPGVNPDTPRKGSGLSSPLASIVGDPESFRCTIDASARSLRPTVRRTALATGHSSVEWSSMRMPTSFLLAVLLLPALLFSTSQLHAQC